MPNVWLKPIIGVILHLIGAWGGLPRQLDTPALCVVAYQDFNRNGINDNEPPLPNVRLALKTPEGIAVAGLLTTSTLSCFEGVAAGTYQIWVEDGPYRILGPIMQPVVLTDEPIIIELATLPANSPFANEICVTVFEDVNQDGVQDATENQVGNIDVWLMTEEIIIATQLTNISTPTCFVGLEEGAYRVKIPATARHQMTTRSDAAPTFVGIGNRYSVPFGLVTIEPFTSDAIIPGATLDMGQLSLDSATRLLLAIMGSGVVILLMIGVGSVAFAFWRR